MQAEQKISEIEVDKEIASLFEPLLGDTEHLIWTGQPKQGFVLRLSDLLFFPLMIFIFIFAAFLLYISVSTRDGMAITAISFLFLSISILYSRLVGDIKRRKQTYYVLSNHRIFIRQDYPKELPIIIRYEDLQRLDLVQQDSGYGKILLDYVGKGSRFLANRYEQDAAYQAMGAKRLEETPAFKDIENAQKVYDIIKTYKNQISQN